MSNRIKNNLKNLVGQTLNQYYSKVKPTISDLRYKQEYQNRIIECMVGEVDDNYITTPETDNPIVKLEHSKEGLVKVPTVKGKTILVDADGNETDTPAEGCKLLSVGEEENNKLIILSKNKNLFDGEFEKGFIGSNGLNVETSSGFYWRTKNYIIFNGSLNLSLKQKGLFSGFIAFFYDLEDNLILETRKLYNPSMFNTLDIPQGANKLRIYFELNSGVNDLSTIFEDMQIEYGTQSTTYIEPKSYKTEILLDEPLRSLPNGVCDEIVGNKVIRRIGTYKFDGSKGFHLSVLDNNDIVRFWTSCNYHGVMNIKSGSVVNCNLLKNIKYANLEQRLSEGIGVKSASSPEFGINLNKSRGILTDQDMLNWLKESNLVVEYELEEPIIEELPNGITLQGFDDTTMYIENSITPTVSYGYNALIPYKQELLNQKEEVEVNTLDIENNIIPYLMDMEFNLMTMEDN